MLSGSPFTTPYRLHAHSLRHKTTNAVTDTHRSSSGCANPNLDPARVRTVTTFAESHKRHSQSQRLTSCGSLSAFFSSLLTSVPPLKTPYSQVWADPALLLPKLAQVFSCPKFFPYLLKIAAEAPPLLPASTRGNHSRDAYNSCVNHGCSLHLQER